MSIAEVIAPLLGRFLIGGYFLFAAAQKAQNFAFWSTVLLQEGIDGAQAVLGLVIFIETVAAVGLILGFSTRVAALVLFTYVIGAAIVLHDYWTLADGPLRDAEAGLFFKDLAIAGALLLLVGLGPGTMALDTREG